MGQKHTHPHTSWLPEDCPCYARAVLKIEKQQKSEERSTNRLDDDTLHCLKEHIKRLEKIKLKTTTNEVRQRLKGGAGNENQSIFIKGITNGKKHGINLVPGVVNKADGNCAFDAVLNNINYRSCFEEKFPLSSTVYRQI